MASSRRPRWDQSGVLTIHIDTGDIDLQDADAGVIETLNAAMLRALSWLSPGPIAGKGLLKVHVGESACVTRMRPEYAGANSRFLREMGARGVVCGDTTVAYTGPRGQKENPPGNASRYLELARRHGWSLEGPAGVPFVVLDRPSTSLPGEFEFAEQEKRLEISGVNRFEDFHLAGGFAAADFVINHAHLTLHGLAGLAGCVKSIAMGCSSLKGKLRMHMSLLPFFNPDLCAGCGQCVEQCPEDALTLSEAQSTPEVDPELCIGCGECEAVCANGAVSVQWEGISDWHRGKKTFQSRMVDYTMGLMNDRWERTVHILHMYSVSRLCDCVNVRQRPILTRDLGFLVGRNPFAIDLIAARMLDRALQEQGSNDFHAMIKMAETGARYAEETYGVPAQTQVERIVVG